MRIHRADVKGVRAKLAGARHAHGGCIVAFAEVDLSQLHLKLPQAPVEVEGVAGEAQQLPNRKGPVGIGADLAVDVEDGCHDAPTFGNGCVLGEADPAVDGVVAKQKAPDHQHA
ncbi:hypothetical protein [Corynebacterium riegelii]|uniref:hypothetical protein n=1 Tax=Corynebacterium riegelii TaxID=156976 RepID=UPI0023F679F5|nr:hypothetical protein [Corynebacterium riegelii]